MVGFDKADGPGGTWYWNRYPGALSDTESHLYRYSFDRDLLQDGSWKSTYITQPEILEYLESVVERFDLRRHFRFGTAVDVRHLPRRRRSVGGHHRRRRRVSRHLCHQRGRTALRHQLPEPARPGDVRGRDHPHRRLARGQGPHGPPRRRHRHRFHRPAGDHGPGAEGRAADRVRPDPAVLGPGRQSPRDPAADRRGEGRLRPDLGAGQAFRRRVRLRGEHRAGDECLRGGAPPDLRGGLAAWRRFPLHVRHLR